MRSRITLSHLVRKVLPQYRDNLAFLLGNGINRYAEVDDGWDTMISNLVARTADGQKDKPDLKPHLPIISPTQIFDLLRVTDREHDDGHAYGLKRRVATDILRSEQPSRCHASFVNAMRALKCPLLTTNFDLQFEESSPEVRHYMWGRSSRPHRPRRHAAVLFRHWHWMYPWSSYASDHDISDVRRDFGIWHLHGNVAYPGSIRLGLDDYSALVRRAKSGLRKLDDSNSTPIDKPNYAAHNSWLNVFMKNNLIILGLGLLEHEHFIRWLLLKRLEYYINRKTEAPKIWYIDLAERKHTAPDCKARNAFLEYLGVEIVEALSWRQMYETLPQRHLLALSRKR